MLKIGDFAIINNRVNTTKLIGMIVRVTGVNYSNDVHFTFVTSNDLLRWKIGNSGVLESHKIDFYPPTNRIAATKLLNQE